ncbi:MAG: hypothetical protein LUH53_00230, partial [Lachnospiraceae bacterium]|nr:hypothetical protein [Lachnospiraceae bacterium]
MQTELDRIANQNHLQLLKALIPHLPASSQKRFSILIKIMEVQNVIRFYSSPPPESSASSDPPDLLDVLADVRCYCEG